MAGQRRPHRKSRTGCRECKRQRIKCGEEKPRCSYCQRRDVTCVYPQNTADQATLLRNTSTVERAGRTRRLGQVLHDTIPSRSCTSDAMFDMRDLALLHHWCVSTSLTIFQDTSVDSIWQKIVPQIAVDHPHAMHSILCLSALHLASVDPSQQPELLVRAAEHHDKSITALRAAISDINNRNCHAVFASATMNAFHVFATFERVYNDDLHGAVPKQSRFVAIDWIVLVRGIGAVLHPAWETVRAGPLQPLFSTDDWGEIGASFESCPENIALLSLREIWSDQIDTEIYDQTLVELQRALARRTDHQYWSGPFRWLHIVPDTYLDRLNQRQPPALVLFAYFGVLVHNLNPLWWADGWGKGIVNEVVETLGPYWAPFMEWPRKAVGLDRTRRPDECIGHVYPEL